MLCDFFIELRVSRIELPNNLDVHVDCVLRERGYPHSIRKLIIPTELKQKPHHECGFLGSTSLNVNLRSTEVIEIGRHRFTLLF